MAKKNVRGRSTTAKKAKATMSTPNFKVLGKSLTAAFQAGLTKQSAAALSKNVIGILKRNG